MRLGLTTQRRHSPIAVAKDLLRLVASASQTVLVTLLCCSKASSTGIGDELLGALPGLGNCGGSIRLGVGYRHRHRSFGPANLG
jgi:hypothetical protein